MIRAFFVLILTLSALAAQTRQVTDAEVMKVHRSALLIDCHNDVPLRTLDGFDIGKRAPDGHTDLVRLREGGRGRGLLRSLRGARVRQERQSAKRALDMIDTIRQDIVLRYPEGFAPAASAAEIEAAHRQSKVAALIGVEGGHAIENNLRGCAACMLGARYMTRRVGCIPEGLDDVSKFPNLTRALLAKGYSADDIRKVYGGNMLRLMRAAAR